MEKCFAGHVGLPSSSWAVLFSASNSPPFSYVRHTFQRMGFASSPVPGNPPSHIWQVLTRDAALNCIDRNPQLYANSAVNIFMDFVVLLLPVPNILQLHMSPAKKMGLLATFLVRHIGVSGD